VRLLAGEGIDAAIVAHRGEMPGAFTVLSAGLVRIRPTI